MLASRTEFLTFNLQRLNKSLHTIVPPFPSLTRRCRLSSSLRVMATLANAPYAPQNVSEVSSLLKGLEAGIRGGKASGSARSKKTSFTVPGTGLQVDSWRFQEWDYKRRDLPTYARGLFTYRRRDNTPEIAVRGYDKFFNVGEVHETDWKNVQEQTRGPYELSVKENGCIIFIAGLEGDHLLVCSKHSTGEREGQVSHAVAGEQWVERHLTAIGKTKSELARDLRTRNVTAVYELCDDSFEEHVLAYEEKDAGLYLHGINLNLPEFMTYPGELVHQFADEWGFKKAQYLLKEDVGSMKTFLEHCAETGSYAGRDTEGFVIRCHRKEHGGGGNYHNWFFKYKFEEPYLMYRQWRECTKAVIAGKAPKFKKHKKITEEYLHYARIQLAKDRNLAKAYNQNHGIIAMRDGFLAERGLKGSDIIQQEQEEGEGYSEGVTHNVVLLPIATIGCGKTTLAIALTKLFDWGHVQNDNIVGKQNRPKQFTTQLCNLLAGHSVAIGDRNNHQKRERKQIIDDTLQIIPSARFVALHYVHDPKNEMLPRIREVTQKRIFDRGDNHQTIQANSKSRGEILGIMEGFLTRFEPLNTDLEPDSGFDEVVDLDPCASSRENLEVVVSALHSKYPGIVKIMPSPEKLDEAMDAAMNDYKPDIHHDLSFKSKKSEKPNNAGSNATRQNGTVSQPTRPPKLEYFCIRLPTAEIISALEKTFSSAPPERARFFRQLQGSRRIQPVFHVTLVHKASIPTHPELWSHLTSLHSSAVSQSANQNAPTFDPLLGNCRVRLERVVWDNRVMCIAVNLLDAGWESANPMPHITVGTASPDIKPKESNDLLQRWMDTDSAGVAMDQEMGTLVEVHGQVRAVMQAQQ